ncbi:MAG: hypothetical protein KDE32_04395 [Novosphingobium sp.]|nr:hypothetical protein [Novosphingobium sp.]
MNIVFDPGQWSPAAPEGDALLGCAHPDWHALRTRLLAAVEARNALDEFQGTGPVRAFGSFSRRAAFSLERITERFDLVNQTSSVNRKRGGCTVTYVAGMNDTGERG